MLTSAELHDAIRNDFLGLSILPTEKCNFRCEYCYEDFSLGRMPRDVQEGIIRLVERRAELGLKRLSLGWFGGEPLVAQDIVSTISSKVFEICSLHGIELLGHITTNGSRLTRPVFDDLLDNGVSHFQVTLDGEREEHNRITKSDSFDFVLGNLRGMRASSRNFSCIIRMHYDAYSWPKLKALLDNVVRPEFGLDPRFRVFFKSLERYGGKEDRKIELLDFKSNRKLDQFLNSKANMSGGDHDHREGRDRYICYASKPNSIIVRSNGRIAKCTTALKDERNDIGSIQADGSLLLDNGKIAHWSTGLFSGDDWALGCPMTYHTPLKGVEFVSLSDEQIERGWSGA